MATALFVGGDRADVHDDVHVPNTPRYLGPLRRLGNATQTTVVMGGVVADILCREASRSSCCADHAPTFERELLGDELYCKKRLSVHLSIPGLRIVCPVRSDLRIVARTVMVFG